MIRDHIKFMGGVFVCKGEGWGPVVTIPYSCDVGILAAFMHSVNEKADGRFVDFIKIPLDTAIEAGGEENAGYDESKLAVIRLVHRRMKLFCEGGLLHGDVEPQSLGSLGCFRGGKRLR